MSISHIAKRYHLWMHCVAFYYVKIAKNRISFFSKCKLQAKDNEIFGLCF